MRPRDIDRISAAHKGVWLYRPASHKTQHLGHDRVIFIGPLAQAVLLRYLARDSDAYCFRPCDSEAKRRAAAHAARKTQLSSGNGPGTNRKDQPKRQPGEQYNVHAYRNAIHRACDKAFPHPELPEGAKAADLTAAQRAELRQWQEDHRWNPNQLRHTKATETRRDHGLEATQIVMGHSKADVTQIYAERDMAKGIEVARLTG
jgi:hypothetical protein